MRQTSDGFPRRPPHLTVWQAIAMRRRLTPISDWSWPSSPFHRLVGQAASLAKSWPRALVAGVFGLLLTAALAGTIVVWGILGYHIGRGSESWCVVVGIAVASLPSLVSGHFLTRRPWRYPVVLLSSMYSFRGEGTVGVSFHTSAAQATDAKRALYGTGFDWVAEHPLPMNPEPASMQMEAILWDLEPKQDPQLHGQAIERRAADALNGAGVSWSLIQTRVGYPL